VHGEAHALVDEGNVDVPRLFASDPTIDSMLRCGCRIFFRVTVN
jgi:hypothetical protein